VRVIVPQARSKQTKDLITCASFRNYLKHKGISLGIAELIMSLGKAYYIPKQPAGFGLVAKLVKASTYK